jgi:polyvinyl alcohol dehydrogenase (cytochrome)
VGSLPLPTTVLCAPARLLAGATKYAKVGCAACALAAWTVGGSPAAAHQGGGGKDAHVHNPLEFIPRAPGPALARGSWLVYGRDLANSRNAGRGGPSASGVRRLAGAWSFRSSDGGFTGTPIIAGRTLIVASAGGSVFALEAATGRLRWKRDFNQPIPATAAVSGGRLYVPVSRPSAPSLVALRLSDGARVWESPLDSQQGSDLYGSPVVSRNTVYIGVAGGFGEHYDADVRLRGNVVAVDARTGRRRWKTYTVPEGSDGGAVWTTPAIDARSGRLYVGTGNAYHAPAWTTTDAIVSMRVRDGAVLGHHQALGGDVFTHLGEQGPDFDFGSSPNLMRLGSGRLVVGELQKSRMYWARDARTMKPVWSRLTGSTPTRRFQDTMSSTAYDGQAIYGQNDDGQVWSLARNGRPRWTTEPLEGENYSPLAVANGVIYAIRKAGILDARSALTGHLLRRVKLGAPCWGGVSVAGGWVFAVTGTNETVAGYVVALRPRAT